MMIHLENNSILDNFTDVFFVLDSRGRFTYLNIRAEQFFLCSRAELIGKCIWDKFPTLAKTNLEQQYSLVKSSQVSVKFEEFYEPLGIWFEASIFPYQENFVVSWRDLSECTQKSHLARLQAKLTEIIAAGESLTATLQKCTEIIVNQPDISRAEIWTYNLKEKQLQLTVFSEKVSARENQEDYNNRQNLNGDRKLSSSNNRCVDENLIEIIARTREAYYGIPQQSQERKKGSLSFDVSEEKSYFIGYPLLLEEKLVGAIAFWCDKPGNSQMEETWSSLLKLIAIGIERCWAKQAKASHREGLIFCLANQIRNSLDLDTILQTAVSEIRSLLQVNRCFYLWCWSKPNHPSLTISHEACDPESKLSTIGDCPPQKLGLLAKTVTSNTILCIDEISNYSAKKDEETIELLTELGISSILLLPLKTRAGHLGAIACSNSEGKRVWKNEEIDILQAVVDQLAIAIDQAELFAQARATALAAQTQAQQLQLTLQQLKQTQGQLIQNEKMSSLGQMIAGIAHEINNPVNFISGNLSCTSEYAENAIALLKLYQKHYPFPDPEIQQYVEDIDLEFLAEDLPKTIASMHVGANRIREIVLSLRNFSRLDRAEMKPVDIHEGIESTLLILHNRLKEKAHQREIQVIKEFGDLPKVECYAGQLNQVLMNILSNAIDALEMTSDKQESNLEILSDSRLIPMIRLRTQLVEDWVRISIADNGPGMSEKIRDRIFDPFFTTKPVGKGTGLGLSISYQIIVEKHGGSFECISAPGEGSEFIIQIPLTPLPEKMRGRSFEGALGEFSESEEG